MKHRIPAAAALLLLVGSAPIAIAQEVPDTANDTSAVARPGTDETFPTASSAVARQQSLPVRIAAPPPMARKGSVSQQGQNPNSTPPPKATLVDIERPSMPIPIPGVGFRIDA